MPPSPDRFAVRQQTGRPAVGLVGDRHDWHGRQLEAALAAADLRATHISLQRCGFTTQTASGLHIDGFGDALPRAVVVRSMAGGSFEAVTLRLGILHALRERGVPVWNDARAIERCVDKSTTSFLLGQAGIATPETWTTEVHEQAHAIVAREVAVGPLVLKPLFGSQGRGLRLIRSPADLPAPTEVPGGVYHLQRFVAGQRDTFSDFRLLVVRGRVVAAMQRHSAHWITNIKRGARPVAAFVNEEMKALAIGATAAVGADFAGVDIIYGADRRAAVLEVNSMPAWSGLQKVTPFNIAAALADALIDALATDMPRGATA